MQHIHLWIYNHPFVGIVDQIDFFAALLKQHGYYLTIGKKPNPSALNVVIENFSATTSQILIDFCKKYHKTIAVIMTEHLDFDKDTKEIKIHGDPLWTENDYMPPQTQIARIQHLIECTPYIRCFFTLGDLPKLHNINEMLPGIPVIKLEFPRINKIINKNVANKIKNDFLFTGFMTNYRQSIISLMGENKLAIHYPQGLVSKKVREILCDSSKIILNIPQRKEWNWLSLMRIISALRLGKPTISLGTKDDSEIAACCHQLEINDNLFATLSDYINNWEELYESCLQKYTEMAEKYAKQHPFPHYFFKGWELTNKNLII